MPSTQKYQSKPKANSGIRSNICLAYIRSFLFSFLVLNKARLAANSPITTDDRLSTPVLTFVLVGALSLFACDLSSLLCVLFSFTSSFWAFDGASSLSLSSLGL